MTERTIKILEAVVENFILSGKPVSSIDLYRRYKFGIRPAMIRSELEELVKEGFLEQPYHSSGRIPANRGYEFFIRRTIEKIENTNCNEKSFGHLFEVSTWFDLVCRISHQMGILVAATNKKFVCKSGFENMLKNLTEEMLEDIRNIARDFAYLERKILNWRFKNDDNFLVFVGKKNPFIKSDSLTTITARRRGNNGETIIIAIGPKRMNYQRTIEIFKVIQKSDKLKKLSI